jgi:hypothetical protein
MLLILNDQAVVIAALSLLALTAILIKTILEDQENNH